MTAEEITIYFVFPAAGYLLGSVPFAWVIGKYNGVDIRTVGSKNIGATNLGRTLGKRFFWQAFLLDAAKGFFPVLVAALLAARGYYVEMGADMRPIVSPNLHPVFGLRHVPFPSWAPLITAAACVIGHLFPVWLKFKGGKGVATGFGVVLGFWPLYTIAGLAAAAFFLFMLLVYRYISLASITGAFFFACLVAVMGSLHGQYLYQPPPDRYVLIAVACAFALMILVRHRANVGRLMKGTEPKIGQREIDKARMK